MLLQTTKVTPARGGADTRANVQLAHLGCNWRKSDREDGRCE